MENLFGDFDFELFYNQELHNRKELGLAPYRAMVAVNLRGVKEEQVLEQASALHQLLTSENLKGIEISDPHPQQIAKLRDQYRYSILLKGKSPQSILAFIKKALKKSKRKQSVILTINVDP